MIIGGSDIGHIGFTSLSYAQIFSSEPYYLLLFGHTYISLFLYTQKIDVTRDLFHMHTCYMPKTLKNSSFSWLFWVYTEIHGFYAQISSNPPNKYPKSEGITVHLLRFPHSSLCFIHISVPIKIPRLIRISTRSTHGAPIPIAPLRISPF